MVGRSISGALHLVYLAGDEGWLLRVGDVAVGGADLADEIHAWQ